MQNLKHLDLSDADFKGSLPDNLGNLSLLESLDLSGNDFSVDNLKWLHGHSPLKILDLSGADLSSCANDWFHDISALPYLVTLHLSCCRLHKLPTSLPEVKFDSLITLDLSINYFNNSIPDWLFENCHHLQLLNLSSCAIPTSMANLSFLAYLNLSYNTLSGKIPTGNQLQTFDEDSYEGNPRLCGPPLRETCPGNSSFEDTHCHDGEERNREHENDGNHEGNGTGLGIYPFYISIAMGFFTGFWVFWGSLVLIASWRYAYFRFLDNMNDRLYVTVAVAHAKRQRKLQG